MFRSIIGFVFILFSAQVFGNESLISPSPDGASVFFIEPADGAVVSETFTVKFGISGMDVAPAGVDTPQTGHHHLLIDLTEILDFGAPLPSSDNVRHFGKGQTETQLSLPPGEHKLQLLLGNYLHIPHNPPVLSKTITITVGGSD